MTLSAVDVSGCEYGAAPCERLNLEFRLITLNGVEATIYLDLPLHMKADVALTALSVALRMDRRTVKTSDRLRIWPFRW